MEKTTRNLIERATQAARRLLEREFAQQLEGDFDILPDGRILPDAPAHLDGRGRLRRAKLVEAVGHRRAAGLSPQEAVAATTREAAFTTLNRFVALKGLEARGMVQECISKGENSAGFREFGGLAPGLATSPDKGYRLYLEALFDEIGREVRVLFDRRDVAGILWPRRQALGDLLDLLNDPALAGVWGEDETIGWVYQYFNGEDERRKMRDESQAPRNSRELAVRNQFFTPRYVVEFLTDNTLGRTWYEMRQGDTRLRDSCRYLVRRKRPTFLALGEEPAQPYTVGSTSADFEWGGEMWIRPNPELQQEYEIFSYAITVDGYTYARDHFGRECADLSQEIRARHQETGKWEGTFEELRCALFFWQRAANHGGYPLDEESLVAMRALNEAICRQWNLETEFVRHRAKKDPRDLKVLDPACGSGHFLLYCFDLLLTIYEEAWADEYGPTVEATGASLRADYPTLEALRVALPGMILSHNLHGIDIDPRAAQIAELALWMRAQRACNDLGLARSKREPIRKTNIVVAEPMPGDAAMLRQFLLGVDERLRPLAQTIWEKMKLAGEAGSLLCIEREIADALGHARRERLVDEAPIQATLYERDRKPIQRTLTGSVEERQFWDQAEETLLDALRDFAAGATSGGAMSRRLFAENAAHGIAFVDLCRKKFDVVLMNPPFGEFSLHSSKPLSEQYVSANANILCAFFIRSWGLIEAQGCVGAIFDRTAAVKTTYEEFRREIFVRDNRLSVFGDLGWQVLDANVETSATVLSKYTQGQGVFSDVRTVSANEKGVQLLDHIQELQCGRKDTSTTIVIPSSFVRLPNAVLGYDLPEYMLSAFSSAPSLEEAGLRAYSGHTLKAERHNRLWWECSLQSQQLFISRMFNGSSYSPIDAPFREIVISSRNLYELPTNTTTIFRNRGIQQQPGICFAKRGNVFCAHVAPAGMIFTQEGRPLPVNSEEKALAVLGLLNTPLFRYGINKYCGQHKTSGYVNLFPYKAFTAPDEQEIVVAIRELISTGRALRRLDETQSLFDLQGIQEFTTLHDYANNLASRLEAYVLSLQFVEELCEQAARRIYHVDIKEAVALDQFRSSQPPVEYPIDDINNPKAIPTFVAQNLFSLAIGVAFGRWDLRFALNPSLTSNHSDLFAPLPLSPPGMLTSTDGLPASSGEIPDEEWLYARISGGTSPQQSEMRRSTIPDTKYPLPIAWDGILVDDPGHPQDIIGRIREVIRVIWGERSDAIYEEATQILAGDGHDLRPWFRTAFFDEHIKRYSKSRRKAPIYWRLATPSNSYALWLYYHRFDRDTLYKALNDYVAPKVQYEERQLATLQGEAGGSPTATQRQAIEAQEAFVEELRTFRDETARIAPLWNPDLNDGVIINFAPLWRLTPRPRGWHEECRDTWTKLARGDYDWAHLAMHLWPARVVKKCRDDRSLAIAHGLDHQFWLEGENGKWQPRHVSDATLDALIAERTSVAVQDALAQLQDAPIEATPAKRAARQERPVAKPKRARKGAGATQLPIVLEGEGR